MNRLGVVLLPLLCLGCWPWETQSRSLVGGNPFDAPPPAAPASRNSYAPGDQTTAERVNRLGQHIVLTNKDMGLKPTFATIGSPTPEIFHQGVNGLFLTDGLVKLCKSDAELAGVLTVELAKMVAEREKLAPPEVRWPHATPPINVPMGNSGQVQPTDLSRLAELGRYEKENPRRPARLLPPDPQKLARLYFERAGFPIDDFEQVSPILDEADRHCAIEKQFKGVPNVQPAWSK